MKIDNITRFFINRPVFFWSLMVTVFIAGVASFIVMPKLEDPPVCTKQAMVAIVYPGASAHEMELKVVQMVEDNLRALPDVDEIRSECRNGFSMITVEFKKTVLQKDVEQHFDLLRRKVSDLKMLLPQGCYDPIVIDDMMDVYGIFYAFTADGMDYAEMDRYVAKIRRDILSVKGIKRVNVVCSRDEVIDIDIDKELLAKNSLLPAQIMMMLNVGSGIVDAGRFKAGDDLVRLRISGSFENENDIKDMVIRTADGKSVRLGDIATIVRHYKEPQTNGFFVNGKPAIAICCAMEKEAVVPDVGRAVDKQVSKTLSEMPVGLNMEKIFFQPDMVSSAIQSFMFNLLESVLIVIVVLIFAMGVRSGLIIGFGLFLTVTMSFVILMFMDSTLQRISLGAFIVAMGMLVDNAIVIMDSILEDKRKGLGRSQYLYRGVRDTAMPLLGATLIATSTFLCVYLSPDNSGEYCRDMFLVLCVSLLSSWILAIVQIPFCANKWIPEVSKKPERKGESRLQIVFRKSIINVLEHRTLTICISLGALALSVYGFTKVRQLFFCDFDYRQFIIEYQMPSETSPDKVKSDLLAITSQMLADSDVEKVSACMGNAPAHYSLTRPMNSGGESYGELIVDCKDFRKVNEVIRRYKPILREAHPNAYIRFRKYNFSIATTHSVEAVVQGPDPAVLRQIGGKIEDIMRKCSYVDAYSVQSSWFPLNKKLDVAYNKVNGLRSGISRSNLSEALKSATEGSTIGVLNDNNKMVMVNMNVVNADGSRIDNVSDMPVWTLANIGVDKADIMGLFTGASTPDEISSKLFRTIPLDQVVDSVSVGWEEEVVRRVNGSRTLEVECDPSDDGNSTPATVMSSIRDEVEALEVPDGYTITWGGDEKITKESFVNVIKNIPITIFIIIFVLLLLFNNWKSLGLVLCCLPFAICGIVPAMLIFSQPMTFMCLIGLLGLIGMLIKNEIVLLDEINRLRNEEHQSPYEATVNATVSRVLPVIMASLTTILGMFPLIADPMYGAMAVSIMAGLTVGTVSTLILFPVFYSMIFKVKISR